MATTAVSVKAHGMGLLFCPQRLLFVLALSGLFGFLNSLPDAAPPIHVTLGHAIVVGLAALLAFGLLEQYPRRPTAWSRRWILQVVGVVIAVPLGVLAAHSVSMLIDIDAAHAEPQMKGLMVLIVEGLLFGPWIALSAMVRQRDIMARDQALAFELERSELERNALEARLRLLQAQVEPHFLFNTLANVQALVDAGSPQAPQVLASLIAYLRAAVPRMHRVATTLGEELDLVSAYLELMQMRMPDRLTFELHVDPAATTLRCPPMTLLTLVENAVRHGIDPSEEGGNIAVQVRLSDGRCRVRVTDTGAGLQPGSEGPGTGLTTLRERLKLAFEGDVRLGLTEVEPHGVSAELEFPARQESR